jgi:hypothetical protein
MIPINENRTKTCLECHKQFEANRLDQKYCNTFCRNHYHNKKVRATSYQTRDINNILNNNYQILKQINPANLSVEELKERGFDFRYITQLLKAKSGENIFLLYDYAYYFKSETLVQVYHPKLT